jgi:hypothetical protein
MMSDVLVLPMPSVSLVFGLDWLPLINGRAHRVVQRMAKQYRATHMVFAGDAAAAVGLGVLRLSRAHHKKMLNSAAQNMAQLFMHDTVALLFELEPAQFWLVAVHDGTVVARTDRLYASRADANAALAELRQAYPQLKVLGAPGASPAPTLSDIEAASARQSQLVPLGRWRSVLPAPVQWFLLALAIVLLAPRFWHTFQSVRKTPVAIDLVDPVQAWQEAIARVSRNTVIHGIEGTRSIVRSLHELPVYLAGWALTQATCTADQSAWRCQARYDRRHRDASNAGLLAGAPKGWMVEFNSIDQAQPVWQLGSAGSALAGSDLENTAHNERGLFSSLQMIKPAFARIELGRSQALNVQPPRDQHGKAIPKPAGLPLIRTRAVHISGPLRSASLLLPYTASIGWREISLTLRDAESVGLKTSRITMSFQGVLYETGTGYNEDAGRVARTSG